MKRRYPAAAAVFTIALISSCWLPPFDQALNESEAVIRKLGSPVRSFSASMRSHAASDGYYLPPRDPASFRAGFWILRENSEIMVRSMIQDSSTSTYGIGEGWSWSSPDRYGDSAVILPAAADPSTLFVFSSDSNGYVKVVRDSSGNVSSGSNFKVSSQAGAGTVPLSSLADRYSSVSFSSGVLSVTNNDVGSSETFTDSSVVVPSYSAAAPTSPVFAALTADSNLFMSARLADGTIGTFEWASGAWTIAPTRLDFIDKKIDGVLSDGRLYARTGDGIVVYDPNAKTSFSVTSGKLKFVYERYDPASSAWVCVFTRATAAVANHSDQKFEYRMEIYEIPTINLRTIAD